MLNHDGRVDPVCGPYWFAGPGFREKHEIYPAKAEPRERYADQRDREAFIEDSRSGRIS
jgi:hypothetical protein